MDSYKDEAPKFRVYPSDVEFTPGGIVRFESYIGQSYIEISDSISENLAKSTMALQLRFKITDQAYGKKVTDLVKGLWGLVLMNKGDLIDPEKIEDFKMIKFSYRVENDYAYFIFEAPYENIKSLFYDFFIFQEIAEEEGIEGFDSISTFQGRTWAELKAEFSPIEILSKSFPEFVDKLFAYELTGTSITQASTLLRMFDKQNKRYGYQPSLVDLISQKIEKPVIDFLTNLHQTGVVECNQSYSAKELKSIIYEFNGNFEDKYVESDHTSFVKEINENLIAVIQGFNTGFFKPYFEIVKCIDFNQLEIQLNVQEKAAFFKLDLWIAGVTEYIRSKFMV